MLAWNQLHASTIAKCWKPLLECVSATEPITSDNEDDNIPLSLLRQKILQENNKVCHDIKGLLQVVIPEETYTEHDIEKWNTIEVDEPIDLDNNAQNTEESGDDDQGEGQFGIRIKATEATKSFDKAIAWAEANITDYASILVLKSLREKSIQKSISERKKQTSIREFFQ